MKRHGNLYERICSMENLLLADAIASKGKSKQKGVQQHRENAYDNLLKLRETLVDKTYKTSTYGTFKIYEPKERIVYRLPYYPDRITHHAIMNVLEPIFMSVYTADTYSSLKGRGNHKAAYAIKRALKDVEGTKYCLKLDIKKFYPNVDHEILKQMLCRKIKDNDLLWLLYEIIDSADGLPIGNYISQFLANFFLAYFDHWLKEVKKVKYYFRYADDLVILAADKPTLHQLRLDIGIYLADNLKLQLKDNYQVFPVAARGIDVLGYVFFHTHVLLRKRIKQNFARMLARRNNNASVASYVGWAKHCNSHNLLTKLLTKNNVQL